MSHAAVWSLVQQLDEGGGVQGDLVAISGKCSRMCAKILSFTPGCFPTLQSNLPALPAALSQDR